MPNRTERFPPVPISLLLCPLDHTVDALADYVQPCDDLVGERMVVPALCPFMIECELKPLHFAFKLKIGALK